MKIKCENEKIIVYLYRYILTLDDIENLNREIKNIFVKLVKVYKLNLEGYFKVTIYTNDNYGCILEIESIISNYEFKSIDLKIIIEENAVFYFKTDNYDIVKKYSLVYYNNGYFYVNLNIINKIIDIIEYGDIIYKLNIDKCQKMST